MKTLRRWQEPIFALGSFGPGALNQILLGWLLFYYRPAGAEIERSGSGMGVLVDASAASIAWIIARMIDGVCDLPTAMWILLSVFIIHRPRSYSKCLQMEFLGLGSGVCMDCSDRL